MTAEQMEALQQMYGQEDGEYGEEEMGYGEEMDDEGMWKHK